MERNLMLRDARRSKGFTQSELALRANVTKETVWRIESGRRCQSSTGRSILKALGVSIEQYWDYFPR